MRKMILCLEEELYQDLLEAAARRGVNFDVLLDHVLRETAETSRFLDGRLKDRRWHELETGLHRPAA